MANLVSEKSKDRRSKIGAVIVGPDREIRSTGYNGFPRGIDDEFEDYHQRPLKYRVTEHAERNCIYHAARIGVSLKDCTLYLNTFPVPCADCTRAIVQAGISTIKGPSENVISERWDDNLLIAKEMLTQVGIQIKVIGE